MPPQAECEVIFRRARKNFDIVIGCLCIAREVISAEPAYADCSSLVASSLRGHRLPLSVSSEVTSDCTTCVSGGALWRHSTYGLRTAGAMIVTAIQNA